MSTARPILFSDPMVRAILDGAKTQTRRVLTFQPKPEWTDIRLEYSYTDIVATYRAFPNGGSARWAVCGCPHGVPGDELWVREAWAHDAPNCSDHKCGNLDHIWYRATEKNPDIFPRWRPSIFMQRWACRTRLEITEIRLQRLQEISEEDARAEGVEAVAQLGILRCSGWKDYSGSTCGFGGFMDAVDSFCTLWDSINAKRGFGWAVNPWVWVISFKRVPARGLR